MLYLTLNWIKWFLSSFPLSLVSDSILVLQITGFYKGLQVSRCKVWNIIDRTTVVKLERYHLKHHIRGAKDRSIYHQKIKIKHLANAASGHPLQSNQPDDYKPKSPLNSVINALDAFYRFSRPHTVIGTVKFMFNDNYDIDSLELRVIGWSPRFHLYLSTNPTYTGSSCFCVFGFYRERTKLKANLTFFSTGIEYCVSCSPCSWKGVRYFSTILHRSFGGNTPSIFDHLKSFVLHWINAICKH